MKKSFLLDQNYINTRLDKWFRLNICEVPQSLIEKNIRKGNIRINNKKNKTFYRLQGNDQILIKNFNFKANKKKIDNKYHPSKKEISSSAIFVENNDNFVVIL